MKNKILIKTQVCPNFSIALSTGSVIFTASLGHLNRPGVTVYRPILFANNNFNPVSVILSMLFLFLLNKVNMLRLLFNSFKFLNLNF